LKSNIWRAILTENTFQLYLFHKTFIVGVALLEGVVPLLYGVVALLDGHADAVGQML
jgi:hypothetical protein